MFKIKKLHIFLLAILLISFIGCTTSVIENEQTEVPRSAEDFPMEIVDSYNRTVLIDSEPQRVISIGPNMTETIFGLGKEDKLVGRSDFCDFPEETENIDTVGSIQEPSIEKIVELKPDIVIVSTHFNKEVIDKIENTGIKIVAFYGDESFEGVYSTIENVGRVLNAKEEAQMVVEEMQEKVEDVLKRVEGRQRPTVYYVVSYGEMGDYTAGGDTFIGKMIEMAGGINAAKDAKGWGYSLEKLIESNPDILICSKYYDSKEGIKNSHGYKDLDAVKNEMIFEIDNNLLDRQGARLAEGLVELAKIIHPEAF
ncbi:ABC transporter substrate-binding protein [Herbivorax sp. ANBcel31]|uniref:ABC transporter substrate-binding protein n=1 Tax=Herbivorax sp. ANBcel31 TaxID=3069754 RepID=UPI0027B331A4|nr:ABC transporter substrate-binding protein [Herbivorax sp. ANBcel31]MDQ2086976.1 ABC transporter substrate-binding protein [Herbivorax sp. ANBcel31]